MSQRIATRSKSNIEQALEDLTEPRAIRGRRAPVFAGCIRDHQRIQGADAASGRSRHQKGTAMSEFHLALGRPRAPTDPPRSFGRPLWSCHSRPSPQRQPLRRRSLTSRRRLSCVERGVRTQRLERWPTNRAGDREVRKVEVPAFGPKLTGGVSGGWAVRQPPQTADFPGRRS